MQKCWQSPVHASKWMAKPDFRVSETMLYFWWGQLGIALYEMLKLIE